MQNIPRMPKQMSPSSVSEMFSSCKFWDVERILESWMKDLIGIEASQQKFPHNFKDESFCKIAQVDASSEIQMAKINIKKLLLDSWQKLCKVCQWW